MGTWRTYSGLTFPELSRGAWTDSTSVSRLFWIALKAQHTELGGLYCVGWWLSVFLSRASLQLWDESLEPLSPDLAARDGKATNEEREGKATANH